MRAGIGLRAQKGGATAIGLIVENGEPRLLLSTFLSTHAEGDRLSFEPYRVAQELGQSARAEAAAAVAEGRHRQDALADASLQDLLQRFGRPDGTPLAAGLLVNRAGWITDLLEYSLEWAEHGPVAEGLAVREALRHALRQHNVETIELDEKSLPDHAAQTLGLPSTEIDARLKALGAGLKPWRKEQKLACLAAWLAATDGTASSGSPAA